MRITGWMQMAKGAERKKKKKPDAWSQIFRLTSSAYWGIISTGSIFFHSLSLLLSRAYTEVSSFLLPSPHTVLMRGYIEIHSVKWDKVSIQSRRDYEKDFVRVCTCACVCISCSDIWKQWAVQHNECVIWQSKKTTLGKKEVRGGEKKIVQQAFRARRLHLFFIHWEYVNRDCPATIKSPAWLIPRVLHTVHCTHRHTHTQPRVAWFFSIFTVMYGSERVMVILFSLPNHLNISPHSFLAVPLDMLHLYIGRFWQMHLELGTRANSNHNLPNTREICSNPTFLLA